MLERHSLQLLGQVCHQQQDAEAQRAVLMGTVTADPGL